MENAINLSDLTTKLRNYNKLSANDSLYSPKNQNKDNQIIDALKDIHRVLLEQLNLNKKQFENKQLEKHLIPHEYQTVEDENVSFSKSILDVLNNIYDLLKEMRQDIGESSHNLLQSIDGYYPSSSTQGKPSSKKQKTTKPSTKSPTGKIIDPKTGKPFESINKTTGKSIESTGKYGGKLVKNGSKLLKGVPIVGTALGAALEYNDEDSSLGGSVLTGAAIGGAGGALFGGVGAIPGAIGGAISGGASWLIGKGLRKLTGKDEAVIPSEEQSIIQQQGIRGWDGKLSTDQDSVAFKEKSKQRETGPMATKEFEEKRTKKGLTGDTKSDQAMRFFMDRGWSKEQAAGIVGNLQVESGNFSEDVVSGKRKGDSGKAVGIAQWHPARQKEFEKLYGKKLEGSTLEEQLEFVNYELTQGSEKKAGQSIKQTKTASEAASVTDKLYERSSGEARAKRMQNAETLASSDYEKKNQDVVEVAKKEDSEIDKFNKSEKVSNEELRVKGGINGQATAGGSSEAGLMSLAKNIQAKENELPGGLNRFTAFNDEFHHEKNPHSKHTEGLAMDFSLKDASKSSEASDYIKNELIKSGMDEKDFKIIDEYKDPSGHATGGHIHVNFTNKKAAEKYAALTGQDATQAKSDTEEAEEEQIDEKAIQDSAKQTFAELQKKKSEQIPEQLSYLNQFNTNQQYPNFNPLTAKNSIPLSTGTSIPMQPLSAITGMANMATIPGMLSSPMGLVSSISNIGNSLGFNSSQINPLSSGTSIPMQPLSSVASLGYGISNNAQYGQQSIPGTLGMVGGLMNSVSSISNIFGGNNNYTSYPQTDLSKTQTFNESKLNTSEMTPLLKTNGQALEGMSSAIEEGKQELMLPAEASEPVVVNNQSGGASSEGGGSNQTASSGGVMGVDIGVRNEEASLLRAQFGSVRIV